jgi:hypothetical protein
MSVIVGNSVESTPRSILGLKTSDGEKWERTETSRVVIETLVDWACLAEKRQSMQQLSGLKLWTRWLKGTHRVRTPRIRLDKADLCGILERIVAGPSSHRRRASGTPGSAKVDLVSARLEGGILVEDNRDA